MTRLFDFFFSFIGLIIFSPVLIIVWIIGMYENGHPIFKQIRVGYKKKNFVLFKFRTMSIDTASRATHLIKPSAITTFGNFLRRTKIDEIPQLFNVLIGDMSLVGPRPCLFNQKKLISERQKRGVFNVKPGITGLAQVKGITMQNPTLLAKTDEKMIKQINLYYYFKYLIRTILFFFQKNSI